MSVSGEIPINIPKKFQDWLKTANGYPPAMREAARRFRHHKLLKESTEPQTGIYFWIPTPDGSWDLMSFFDSHYGSTMHDKMWSKEVVPNLCRLWKLNAQDKVAIYDAYAGVPRGRVCKTSQGFKHYCGGDAPVPAKRLDTIIKKEFGLTAMQTIPDDHERMIQDDVSAIQLVFGDLGLKGISTDFY